MSWDQYSQTPASNYVAPYAFTGMAPSLVKVAISNVMADLSQFMSLPTSGGTANAQTVTNTRQFAALFTGMRQSFIPGNTNTGAVTFAPDGLTAKNVFANGVAAIAGMLVATVPAHMQYDGTQWQLINPQRSTGSFTGTLATGLTTTPTGTMNYAVQSDGITFVTWCASAITGTSNTSGLTMTGIPSILTATTNKECTGTVVNSGANSIGGLRTGTSTTWTFTNGGTSNGFTTTGTKGIPTAAFFSLTKD